MGLRLIINFPAPTTVSGEQKRVMLRNAEAVNFGSSNFTTLGPAFWNFNTSLWDNGCPSPDNISAAATEVCPPLGLYSFILPQEFWKIPNFQLDYVIFDVDGPVEDPANYTLLDACGCAMNTGDSDLTFGCNGSHLFGSC